MARPRAISNVDLDQVLPRLLKRDAWPAALLAELLGCSRRTVYNYAYDGLLNMDWRGVETTTVVALLKDETADS